MYNSPFSRNDRASIPTHFKDNARNAIYQQLPVITSSANTIRSAPSPSYHQQSSFRSSTSSIFSRDRDKKSVRSAPSLYSNSTATIPEDSEQLTVTVEQLVNDISLHETFYQDKVKYGQELDDSLISLGGDLSYQSIPEMFIDWNLNVTRSKLIITDLPKVSSVDFQYSSNSLPQLIGDLASVCQIMLISPTITDKELIYSLFSSNIYQEHDLDGNFKKSVAEISVKQSRLLQINSSQNSFTSEAYLKLNFKKIAIRNYLINLAAAASTSVEYKAKIDEVKKQLKSEGKGKLNKDMKKSIWDQVRSDVFKRAGLES